MIGNIITHSLYLTRDASCTAPYGDAAYIPFFYHEPLTGEIAAQVFDSNHGQPFMLTHQHSGVSVRVNPGKYGATILRQIDGQKSFGEIFEKLRADWHGQAAAPDNQALFADFAESYETAPGCSFKRLSAAAQAGRAQAAIKKRVRGARRPAPGWRLCHAPAKRSAP
jgi:hypothetical protein